jgi:hypothetical protein
VISARSQIRPRTGERGGRKLEFVTWLVMNATAIYTDLMRSAYWGIH